MCLRAARSDPQRKRCADPAPHRHPLSLGPFLRPSGMQVRRCRNPGAQERARRSPLSARGHEQGGARAARIEVRCFRKLDPSCIASFILAAWSMSTTDSPVLHSGEIGPTCNKCIPQAAMRAFPNYGTGPCTSNRHCYRTHWQKMITTPACFDCMDLVGAPRTKRPHGMLLPVEKDSAGRVQFRCTECAYRWTVGPLGWASLWD